MPGGLSPFISSAPTDQLMLIVSKLTLKQHQTKKVLGGGSS